MKLLLILSTVTSLSGLAMAKDPSVKLSKTVHHGSQTPCSAGQETAHGFDGSPVTYCYELTNDGETHLSGFRVTDAAVGFSSVDQASILAPGESVFLDPHYTTIKATISSSATALANPVDADGKDLAGMADVTSTSDAAGVIMFDKTIPDPCTPDGTINMAQKFGIK